MRERKSPLRPRPSMYVAAPEEKEQDKSVITKKQAEKKPAKKAAKKEKDESDE